MFQWSGSSLNTPLTTMFTQFLCFCCPLCLLLHTCVLSHFSHVQLFATLWTVAHQVPLSMGFSRQEYWSRLLCPPPGDLPDPGIEPRSLHFSCIGRWVLYHRQHLRNPLLVCIRNKKYFRHFKHIITVGSSGFEVWALPQASSSCYCSNPEINKPQ